jgi:hypothetical protein
MGELMMAHVKSWANRNDFEALLLYSIPRSSLPPNCNAPPKLSLHAHLKEDKDGRDITMVHHGCGSIDS